jgi:hypothetical protein
MFCHAEMIVQAMNQSNFSNLAGDTEDPALIDLSHLSLGLSGANDMISTDVHGPDEIKEKIITIKSKRGKKGTVDLETTKVIDCTSSAGGESAAYIKLSPFTSFSTPEGGPAFAVPGMPGVRSFSVEGVWQGLKLIGLSGSTLCTR